MEARVSSRLRIWLIVLAALLVTASAAAAAVGVAVATDESAFCASCHEMQPFHEAWAEGPHADVACVDCHVDRGLVARVRHKLVALDEVRAHVLGRPTFPLETAPEVPDERCVGCHENVMSARPGFSHAEHATKGPCQTCHADAGHDVTTAALGKAGILNEATLRARSNARVAVVGRGSANLAGHVSTDCETCHDMSATSCGSCHTAKHAARAQDCGTCHRPGPEFAFAHPDSPTCTECHARPAKHADDRCTQCHPGIGVTWAFNHDTPAGATGCAECHARPADHDAGACSTCHASGATWAFNHPSSESCAQCHEAPERHYGTDCSSCHTPTVPFDRATLQHPSASATCTDCHRRPTSHRAGACNTCHPRVGASWSFAHPSSKSCTTCHRPPAGHPSSTCTSCHPRVGTSWVFAHPGSSSTCTACHARPGGHAGGACTTCHRVGRSWAFAHPSSSSCASCHTAPASHYGAACASCHSPGASWSSASFRHAAIRGGEHTYRSFACANCHPNGYSSSTCIACHETATGPGDDDDD